MRVAVTALAGILAFTGAVSAQRVFRTGVDLATVAVTVTPMVVRSTPARNTR